MILLTCNAARKCLAENNYISSTRALENLMQMNVHRTKFYKKIQIFRTTMLFVQENILPNIKPTSRHRIETRGNI